MQAHAQTWPMNVSPQAPLRVTTFLMNTLAGMEGAHAAFAFTSGMAALANMTRLLKAGDEVLCNADIYGGMYRLLSKVVLSSDR